MIQKISRLFLMCTIISSLVSCASTHYVGEGGIVDAELLTVHNYALSDTTEHAVKLAGTMGAVSGGIVGGAIGLLPGIMSGSSAGLILCTVSGVAIGATIFGVTAGAVVGTVGYATDLVIQNRSQYQFKVKQDNQSQILTVTQYSGAIPLNTSVRILEKNGTIFVRKN